MSLNQQHELIWVTLCWLVGAASQPSMSAAEHTGKASVNGGLRVGRGNQVLTVESKAQEGP